MLVKASFAIVLPIGALIGIGWALGTYHFFQWVQANGIQDWQVGGLFIAFVAAVGLVIDRCAR